MMPAPVFSRIGPLRTRSGCFPGQSGFVFFMSLAVDSHEEGMPYFAHLFGSGPASSPGAGADHWKLWKSGPCSAAAAASRRHVPDNLIDSAITISSDSPTLGHQCRIGSVRHIDRDREKCGHRQPRGLAATGSPPRERWSSSPIRLPHHSGHSQNQLEGQSLSLDEHAEKRGAYQIEAEFLPDHNFFAASTSAPLSVTITPKTLNAPTVTSLQAIAMNVIETGEPLTLNATVQNANSTVPDGFVKFVTVSRHPVMFGEVNLTASASRSVSGRQRFKRSASTRLRPSTCRTRTVSPRASRPPSPSRSLR